MTEKLEQIMRQTLAQWDKHSPQAGEALRKIQEWRTTLKAVKTAEDASFIALTAAEESLVQSNALGFGAVKSATKDIMGDQQLELLRTLLKNAARMGRNVTATDVRGALRATARQKDKSPLVMQAHTLLTQAASLFGDYITNPSAAEKIRLNVRDAAGLVNQAYEQSKASSKSYKALVEEAADALLLERGADVEPLSALEQQSRAAMKSHFVGVKGARETGMSAAAYSKAKAAIDRLVADYGAKQAVHWNTFTTIALDLDGQQPAPLQRIANRLYDIVANVSGRDNNGYVWAVTPQKKIAIGKLLRAYQQELVKMQATPPRWGGL